MPNEVIIIGAFHEIIELAQDSNVRIVGLIDNEKIGYYKGYEILGNDKNALNILNKYNLPLIITPDSPNIKSKLNKIYSDYRYFNLISPKSNISKSAQLGKGIVVQSGVNVSADTRIGDFVKLNTNSNVMHDSIIGRFSTIAPNAVILGYVKIGERCYIGANATVMPNLSICDDVVIGAGAVLTKNVDIPGKYAGVPARRI